MEKCPVCGFPIDNNRFCSNFCCETSEEEQTRFLNLGPGEWGVYPCAECGCAIEGEYVAGEVCSTCGPKVMLRRRTELLQKVVKVYGVRISGTLPEIRLLKEIRKELGIKQP